MGDRRTNAIPASVEAAWGVRGRPARGPKPGLSLERIVAGAIRVAEAEGLGAVSMSRVAAEIGSSPMSLYRYVAAKDELLALMLDAVVPADLEPLGAGETWRMGLERWARRERVAFMRQPWAVRIPRSGPPITPNQTRWLEAGLSYLRGTGLTPGEKLSTILLVSGFVWNEVLLYADMAEAMRRAAPDGVAGAAAGDAGTIGAAYGQAMARLTDADRFPELHAILNSGLFGEPDDLEVEFEFGLARILDGIDVLIRSRAG